MKTKIKVLLGIVMCVVIGCVLFVGCKDKNNDQEPDILEPKTIEVGTEDELFAIGQYVGEKYKNYTIKLTDDIVLTKEWTPVGLSLGKAFCGTFDGNGKTISGLKITGWDESGTPKYVAKQILGWSENGQPVYKSSEVLSYDKGDDLGDGIYVVSNIVKQGDDADPAYAAVAGGNGERETETSYGSVGFFGYTKGATIKNVTLKNADISYYASGDYSYAGIVSGCAVAGEYENVKVIDGKIRVSHVYEQKTTFNMNNATPNGITNHGVVNEYAGGVVGYVKGMTEIADGKTKIVATKFSGTESVNFNYGNANYEAFYDYGLTIRRNPVTDKADDNLLCVDTNVEQGYNSEKAVNSYGDLAVAGAVVPLSTYVGGVAGYASGASIDNAIVDGFNKFTVSGDSNAAARNTETEIVTKALYAAGIVGGLYSSEANTVTAKNVGISGVYWRNWDELRYVGLVRDKATAGGAFGVIQRSKITSANAENVRAEVCGSSGKFENVCMGGVVGYADDQSSVTSSGAKKVYFYSSFNGSGELGSLIGGAVAVVRNSTVEKVSADEIKVEIGGGLDEDYVYTRGIVSQVYGNSSVKDSTAKNVFIYKDRYTAVEYENVTPVVTGNNYVNENGYPSVRLYYAPEGGRYDKVYVTAYAELIGRDKDGNLLVKKDVYVKTDAFASFENGQDIPENMKDKYYVYNAQDKKYIFIRSASGDRDVAEMYKKYNKDWIYATKETAYEVVILDKNKKNDLDKSIYKEYDETKASLTATTDGKAQDGKSYYITGTAFESIVSDYVLDVTLYAESSKQLVLDPKDKDNDEDDVKAYARYSVVKSVVDERTATMGTKTVAETFIDTFFASGEGFKKDVDGNVMKYYDSSVKNRNFADYKVVTGRPEVSGLQYQH